MLTTFNEVNMKPIMDLRKTYQKEFEDRHGIRLGFMSFYVKAVVEALKRFPRGERFESMAKTLFITITSMSALPCLHRVAWSHLSYAIVTN